MLERLTALDWVPSVSPADDDEEPPRRELVDNPLILQNAFPGGLRFADPTDFAAAVEQVRAASVAGGRDPEVDVVAFREQVNRWRALQKLYRDCGWPREGFRGDELRARMGEWVRRAEEVRYELYAVLGGGAGPTTEETRARREHVTRNWEAFWAEAAGEGFV